MGGYYWYLENVCFLALFLFTTSFATLAQTLSNP